MIMDERYDEKYLVIRATQCIGLGLLALCGVAMGIYYARPDVVEKLVDIYVTLLTVIVTGMFSVIGFAVGRVYERHRGDSEG